MTSPRAMVKNASDATQVRKAGESEKDKRTRELEDLKELLRQPVGRRVLWRFIGRCGPLRSIMETSAKIYYNSGQQDLGHWLVEEICATDQNAWILMQQEAGKLTALLPSAPPTSEEDES